MQKERDEEIRKRAYELWEEEGYPDGREHEHWQRAEAEFADAGATGSEANGAPLSPDALGSGKTRGR
ncbi:DUF2934 domain-containing protein [Arsenicitalea aurantiaca]|uniref:DUF2934 domain-containing protein n=1 Tax=Arsenicitalea aurantiaca TaxID=1783274 RepID=A0A433X8J4_9HYPH|nr:DUF2934 domain-containing protein [Arsenicitalea aurantiaca]RUT30374.1 DUF2934 domain-containing protein [Arsenicitalea aurantiaca]